MFNPFKKLTPEDLNVLIEANCFYAAAQHYKRAFPFYGAHDKTGLLITPYKYQGDAQKHIDGLEDKRHAALIHLNHQTHLLQLQKMLSVSSPYLLYNGNLKDQESILKKHMELFKPQLLNYLNRDVDTDLMTTFKTVPMLKKIYGEFYVTIGEGFDQLKINLEIIEEI